MSLHKGTSWSAVSNNVKQLVHEWEQGCRIGRSRPTTRKQAINLAVAVALRAAGRSRRASSH